jgi:transposase
VRGWFPKGSHPTIKYILNSFQKIHVFGALGFGKVFTKLSPKLNSKKFLPFIRRLRKHCRKLCIVIDNARWHLTKSVLDFVRTSRIKLVRLLPYSPELNPIEQYWKNIKQWLGLKPIFSKADLIRELKSALRKDIFLPKISEY